MRAQALHGLAREALEGAAFLIGEAFQERGRERLDVASALPQRRQADGEHVEAVVEILPKTPRQHFGLGVAMSGADDADVGLPRPRLADAAELAGLQHAQKLGLQGELHLADLVEEERSALRGLDRARPVFRRAREGAADMAEDFRLHQLARDGAAVQRDEGLLRPAGTRVHGFGAELLAGAALAHDEDRRAGRRDALDLGVERAHGRRGAHEGAEVEAGGLLRCRFGFRRIAFRDLREAGRETFGERVGRIGLQHEVDRAAPHGFDGERDRSRTAGRDH